MRWNTEVLSLVKAGNSPDDYEDATESFAFSDEGLFCAAITDGASSGFESRIWARALASAFAQHPPRFNKAAIQLWLEGSAQQWQNSIRWQELKWYQEAKAHQGAFATLLGIILQEPDLNRTTSVTPSNRWSAVALGDACLFQIRDNTLLRAFPIESSSEFGTSPSLLSTRSDYNERSLEALTKYNGTYEIGDVFLLMTDALAHWFLREVEAGHSPWNELNIVEADYFSIWIGDLREAKLIHNDDVTLVRCFLESKADSLDTTEL